MFKIQVAKFYSIFKSQMDISTTIRSTNQKLSRILKNSKNKKINLRQFWSIRRLGIPHL